MRSPADLPNGCASKSSPLPPAAALLSALRFVELPFQPRHQVFSGLQPRLLFAQADLSLSDTLLCGLMFAAAMIRLLLSQRPPPVSFWPATPAIQAAVLVCRPRCARDPRRCRCRTCRCWRMHCEATMHG